MGRKTMNIAIKIALIWKLERTRDESCWFIGVCVLIGSAIVGEETRKV